MSDIYSRYLVVYIANKWHVAPSNLSFYLLRSQDLVNKLPTQYNMQLLTCPHLLSMSVHLEELCLDS